MVLLTARSTHVVAPSNFACKQDFQDIKPVVWLWGSLVRAAVLV
jgi:hypothetical protein